MGGKIIIVRSKAGCDGNRSPTITLYKLRCWNWCFMYNERNIP